MTTARIKTPDAKIAPLSKSDRANPSDEKIIDNITALLNEEKYDEVTAYLRALSPLLSREVVLHKFQRDDEQVNLLLVASVECKDALPEVIRLTPQPLLEEALVDPIIHPEIKGVTPLHTIMGNEKISKESKILLLDSVSVAMLNANIDLRANGVTPLIRVLSIKDDDVICAYLNKIDNDIFDRSIQLRDPDMTTIAHILVIYNHSDRVVDAVMRKLRKETVNELCSTKPNIVSLSLDHTGANGTPNTAVMRIADYVDRQILVDAALRILPSKTTSLTALTLHGPLMHKLRIAATQHFDSDVASNLTSIGLSKFEKAPMESLRYMVALHPQAEEQRSKFEKDSHKENKIVHFFRERFASKKAEKDAPDFKAHMSYVIADQLNKSELAQLLALSNILSNTVKNEDGHYDIALLMISYLDTTYFMHDVLQHELHAPHVVPAMTAVGQLLDSTNLNKAFDASDEDSCDFLNGLFVFATQQNGEYAKTTEGKQKIQMLKKATDKLILATKIKKIEQGQTVNPENNSVIQTVFHYLSSNPHTLLAVNQELRKSTKEKEDKAKKEKESKRSLLGRVFGRG